MLLALKVLVRALRFLEAEHFVNNRLELLGLNKTVHILESSINTISHDARMKLSKGLTVRGSRS